MAVGCASSGLNDLLIRYKIEMIKIRIKMEATQKSLELELQVNSILFFSYNWNSSIIIGGAFETKSKMYLHIVCFPVWLKFCR